MPISRMQQPRQMYGLGSLVKSVTKGAKKVVSGAVDTVKDVAKSDLGKAALAIAAVKFGGPLAAKAFPGTFGSAATSPFLRSIGTGQFLGPTGILSAGKTALLGSTGVQGTQGLLGKLGLTSGGGSMALTGLGKVAGITGISGLLGFMSQQGMSEEEIEQVSRNPEALKVYLRQYYSQLNPKASPMQIDRFVEANTAEYRADGGRIGFQQGGNFDFNQFLQDRTREAMQVQGIGQAIRPVVESNVRAQAARDLSQAARGGGIESFLRGQLGAYGIIPGMSAMQSPMTGTSNFGRKQVIDALTKSYMNQYNTNYTPASASAPPPSKTPLELKMEANKKIYDEYMLKNSPIPTPGVNTSPPPIFYEDKSLIDRLTALSPEEAFRGETFETLSDVDQYNFAQAFPQFQSQLRDPNYVSSYGPDPIEAFRRRYGLKEGGRIGYGMGSLVSNFVKENPEIFRAIPESKKVSPSSINGMGGILAKFVRNNPQIFMDLNSEEENRDMVAMGGRMQYALGTPEQNAMQASEIMDLPLNQNPAGITELDLRDSGGFIPPVGVKEKADDIPAMLSNNEFVFTADAVRGMGDGDVNKGAQRMYDMMKKLENGGRV